MSLALRMAAITAVALLSFATTPTRAQVPGAPPPVVRAQKPVGETKRVLYYVRHGSAKELSRALGQIYKGDAEIEAVSEGNGKCLLIKATPRTCEEILALLEKVDRPLRVVAIDIWIVETPDKDEKPDTLINPRDLTGSTDTVTKKLRDLQNKGTLGSVRHYQMSTAEGRDARIQLGESKPMVTGSTGFGGRGGGTAVSITYRETGVMINAYPVISESGGIALDLKIEDSGMRQPNDGPQVGTTDKGAPIRASVMTVSQVKTLLNVKSGEVTPVTGVKTEGKSKGAQTLILVGAHVVDGTR